MIIIQPIGGLCNRMRSINSALMLAKERKDKVIILWNNNTELNCPFEELFLPSDKAKVINIYSKWNIRKLWYQLSCHFISNEEIRNQKGDGLLAESYRNSLPAKIYIATEEHFYPNHDYSLFQPRKEIAAKISSIKNQFGENAVGVHIRRTDNKPAMGKSTTDAFVQSMQEELDSNPSTKFYLATDDMAEEQKLRKLFPGCILSNENRDLSRNSISGIQDALIDLYCLSNTKKIIGSYFSSFTDIAADINDIPKLIAGMK